MKLTSTALALLPVFSFACAAPVGHAPETLTEPDFEPQQPAGVHLPRGPALTSSRPAAQPAIGTPNRSLGMDLAAQLRTQRVSGLHFENESSLRSVMRFMQALTGINVHVEQAAEEAMLDEGNTIDLHIERSMTVTHALNLLTDLAGDDVVWVVRHGVVLVTTSERAVGEPTTVVYDISDLLFRPRSFVARDINVSPSGGIYPAEEDPIEPGPIVDQNVLLELIMSTIDPDSWDRGRNSITIRGGKLIVTHD